MKNSAVIVGSGDENQENSPIEFMAMPSNVKVPSNGTTILNVVAKLKNSYQLSSLSRANSNMSTGSIG